MYRRALLAALATVSLGAQVPPIVVSEYFNTSPLPVEEWTELLVIADTLDLRGYILTDNNQTQTQQQGGVRFRDVPLWRHLRAGTIIVINHRGSQVVDDDPRDGYIEIGAQNTTYFEQVRLDSNPGLSWEDVALNIALQGDLVQVLDPQGRHVHALGHRDVPGPFYESLPPPKVHHNGQCPNPGSVRVVPGLSLAAYAAGAGTDSTAALSSDVTKGLPNQSPQHRDRNQLLWRWLRQPRWRTPQIVRAELTPTGILLEWSVADDPLPQDSLQGYIVIRDTAGQQSVPEDGRTYVVGERVGSGRVVAQTVSSVRQALDTFAFPCGARMVYRVYAFRYRTDDRLGNAPGATLARGRSYAEETYAEAVLEKPLPPAPRVQASATEFCAGDSAVLWVEQPDTVRYRYQWFLNGQPIGGATAPRIVVRSAGRYSVRVQTEFGCAASSPELEIQVHPEPQVWIAVEGDTLLCPGDTVVLRAVGAWRYYWYRDGVLVDSAAVLRVTQPGRYWVTGWDQFGCWATSAAVELQWRRIEIVVHPDTLDFGALGACESTREQTIRLTNTGTTPVLLFRPILPAGFAAVGQSFPVSLEPGQRLELRLRFLPPRSGSYGGVVRFPVHPCLDTVSFPVRGLKQAGIAAVELAELDFGTEALCQARVRDTTFWLLNQSGGPLQVEVFPLAPPFELVEPVSPVVVPAGDSLRLRLRYVPQAGSFQQEVRIVARMGACLDTLRVPLLATAVRPELRFAPSQLVFPPLRGCTAVAETSLAVHNTSVLPLRLEALPVPGVTVIGTPLELQPLESRSITVRVTPPGAGTFAVEMPFLIEPCGDTLRVPVHVSVAGVSAGFALGALDFGALLWCGRLDTVVRELTFTSRAGVAELLAYSLQGDTGSFSLGWNPGQRLADGQSVSVRFHPPQPGRYRAEVVYRLRVDTCTLERRLLLSAEAWAVAYDHGVDSWDFGAVVVGQRARRSLTVRNVNPFPLVLEAVEGIVPPFSLEQPLLLPDTLRAGEERVVGILYTPVQAPRWDTLRLRLRWSIPCDTAFGLLFVAEAVAAPERAARVYLEVAPLRAAPGETVAIPILVRAQEDTAARALRRVQLSLRYDWRLFEPQRLEGASSFSWHEQGPGELRLEGYFPEGVPSSGELVRIRGRALWHPQMETPLELRVDTFESRTPLELVARSGLLRVDSACWAWERRFGTGKATTVRLQPGDCPELVLELGSDEEAELRLLDLHGREVFAWHGVPSRDRREGVVPLPCSSLAPGAYGALLRQGGLRRFLWFVLVR